MSNASTQSDPPSSYAVGTRVVLADLTKAPQYNGKTGVVRSSLNSEGRQHVDVSLGGEADGGGDADADADASSSSLGTSSGDDGTTTRAMALRPSNLRYEPRSVDSLSARELKSILGGGVETAGMDIGDLRRMVSEEFSTDASHLGRVLGEARAKSVHRADPAAATSPAVTVTREQMNRQADQMLNMSPSQLRQQAQMMRSMDPATLRRMNPQMAAMSDGQIRAAADQMDAMASNPEMMRMAAEQVKSMGPEELERQRRMMTGGAGAGAGGGAAPSPPADADQLRGQVEQLSNLSPDQLRQQARMMKSVDPASIRTMNPQLASMTDDQIRAAADQMEAMAGNPDLIRAASEQMRGMSAEDLEEMRKMQEQMARGGGGGGGGNGNGVPMNGMDPMQAMQSMDPKQIKSMLEMVKKNPALVRQMMAGNPAAANVSEEQLRKSIDMFASMDERQLERALGWMQKIQRVAAPVKSAWDGANARAGGRLGGVLLLVLVLAIAALLARRFGGGGGFGDASLGDERAAGAASMQQPLNVATEGGDGEAADLEFDDEF